MAIISASILFDSRDILLKHINKESQNKYSKNTRLWTFAAMGFKIQLMAVLLLAAVSGSQGTYIAYLRFIYLIDSHEAKLLFIISFFYVASPALKESK